MALEGCIDLLIYLLYFILTMTPATMPQQTLENGRK